MRTLIAATALTTLVGLALGAQSSATAQTGGPGSIVFILDASGSMAAKTGSTTKMEAAKQVMTDLVGNLPPGTRAGLMAYGHRQKSACTDVELVLPVEAVVKDVFGRKINALQPLGQTPISESIRQAAAVLKGVSGKRSIILVSDGEETCKQDPCKVAADLKKADIDLKVHVVGFGLDTPAAKQQLKCVATATGGTYAEASNPAELKRKISEVATSESKPAITGKLVSVILDMDGSPVRYGVSFYKPGGKAGDTPLESTFANQAFDSVHELNVPPGIYDVSYSGVREPTLWKRNVEIKPGQITRVEFPRFGRIRISIKDQTGKSLQMGVEVHDSTPQQTDLIGYHGFRETIDLPAGTYDILFGQMGLPPASQKGVVVKSGQETPVNVSVRVK